MDLVAAAITLAAIIAAVSGTLRAAETDDLNFYADEKIPLTRERREMFVREERGDHEG